MKDFGFSYPDSRAAACLRTPCSSVPRVQRHAAVVLSLSGSFAHRGNFQTYLTNMIQPKANHTSTSNFIKIRKLQNK